MDYTQNYHLPQWEKTDRVLMDDFNSAMANLDEGISAAQSTAEALAGQISKVDQDARSRDSANTASAQSALRSGLFRAAYNQYHAACALAPLPRQNGFFHQKLLPECCSQTGFSGFQGWNGAAIWAAKAGTVFTHKNLIEDAQVVQQMTLTGSHTNSSPLIAEITTPGPGFFTMVKFAGTIRNVTASSAHWRVVWENLDTNEIEMQFEQTISLDQSTMSNNTFRSLDRTLFFHQGHYRLTITPLDCPYTGYYSNHGDYSFYATTLDTGKATIERTLALGETGTDGLLSLVLQEQGPGRTLKLTWDGKTVQPFRTHTYSVDGQTLTELEFRKGGSVNANSSVKLEIQCQTGHSIILRSWGVILI